MASSSSSPGVDSPEVAQLATQHKEEQPKLRAQLFPEKPTSQQLRALGFKITKAEHQITKQQAARAATQAQLVALQEALREQDQVLAASRAQLLELEGRRKVLCGALHQAPSGPPGQDQGDAEASWAIPKLEQVLLAAGASGELQQEVVGAVDKLRQC